MDESSRQRRRRGRDTAAPAAARAVDYRRLTSPLPLARGYSDDHIADIHDTALTVLTVLQELGVRMLDSDAGGVPASRGGPGHGRGHRRLHRAPDRGRRRGAGELT